MPPAPGIDHQGTVASAKWPEARSQKPEARGQRPEARGQRPEARGQKPEARSQKPEARSQKNERKLHPRSCVSSYSTFNKGVREGSHAVAVDDACSNVLHWCGH